MEKQCEACSGTGHIPRPFPATAQPITRLALTTEPNEREFGTIEKIDHSTRIVRYYRWPGLEIELPQTELDRLADSMTAIGRVRPITRT